MLGSKNEKGQATIEFALALPLLVVFVMLIAQFAIVARQQLALSVGSGTQCGSLCLGFPRPAIGCTRNRCTERICGIVCCCNQLRWYYPSFHNF